MNTFVTFRVILTAALCSLAAGPVAFWFAYQLKLLDIPGSAPHKLHKSRMPLAGGLVIFITLTVVAFIEGILDHAAVRSIILPAAIVFVFGLLDDRDNLSPAWKFAGQLLAASLLIYLGVHVRMFQQEWINYLITIVWIVGVTNAYNFVDSMDGLATGLAGLAFAFFMLVTIDSQQGVLSVFSMVMVGACFGSFYYNASPAYYFLGDSGSQLLGFLLAALGIAYSPLGFSIYASWYVPILLVGVPIFDTTLVVVSRLRHGRPVYQAGRDHTYHRLVAMGLHPNRAVLTMHVVSILLGFLAFVALSLPPLWANGIFATVVLLGAGTIFYFESTPRLQERLLEKL